MFSARQKIRVLLFVALIIIGSAFVTIQSYPQGTVQKEQKRTGQVAGIIDGEFDPNSLYIRIPTNIANVLEAASIRIADTLEVFGTATFNGDVIMNGTLQLPDDVEAQGITLNLGEGTILASNLLYGLEAGSGITIGTGQTPLVTNTGVLSLQGSAGALSLVAGDGITLDGLTISSTSVTDEDTIRETTGFRKDGSVVSLQSSTDNVGLGTSSPVAKLDVIGAVRLGATGSNNILNTSVGSGAPTGILYWGNREICDSSNNCGTGGGSSAWSALTDPTANLSLNMSGYTTTFNYNNTTGASNLFNIADATSNTGTGYLFTVSSGAGSAANPIRISAQNNNVFIVNSAGLVSLGSTIKTGLGAEVTSDLSSTPASTDVNFALRTGISNGNVVRLGFFENTDFKSAIESGRETSDLDGYLAFRTRNDSGVVNEAARVTASGNVGVGTTVPGARFAVGTGSQFQVSSTGDLIRIKNLAYSWPTGHGSAGAVLTNDGSGALIWTDTSSTAGPWAASGNDVYPDSTAYNVSIGTTVPTAKLHVAGTSLFTSTATFQATTVVSGNSQTLTSGTSLTGGTIASSGNIEITPTNSLIVGSDLFAVTSAGNVGLGTSSPGAKLDIRSGELRLSTATNYIGFALPAGLAVSQLYTLPLLDGNDGDVLTTDGNGNLSWELVDGGGGGGTILSDITAADATNTINNASLAQVWNWQLGGVDTKGFTFGESAASGASGNSAILYVNTLTTSSAVPLHISNAGGAYSLRVDDSGTDSTPFIIDATGNVGIGTTASSSKLDAVGGQNGITPTATFSHDVRVGTANTNGGGIFFGSTNYGYTAADYIRQTAAGSLYFYGGGTSARATQLVVSNGNVGIGTTAPANMFAAGSASQFQISSLGDLAKIKDLDYSWPSSHGSSNYVLTNDGSGGLTWSAVSQGSVSWSDIGAPSANLTLSMNSYTTNLSYGNSTSSNNLFTISDASNNTGTGYLFNLATGASSTLNPLNITVNNGATDVMMVSSGGNIGIGTTTPGSKIDIKGTLRLSGATSGYVGFTAAASAGNTTYTWPASAGSNGQVLTSNGSGALSWTSIAAAGAAWSYSNPVIYNSTASDVVHIGNSTRVGKLGVTGDTTNEPVLYLRAPASLTSPYFDVRNSSNVTAFSFTAGGNIAMATANAGFQTSASGTTKVLDFSTESTGVNYLRITNSNGSPQISAQQQGGATDLDIRMTPLGTGDVNITTGGLKFSSTTPTIKMSNTVNALSFTQVSTGANYFNIQTSNGGPQLQVQGVSTNVDLVLVPKGTGDVTINTGGIKFVSSTPAIKFNNGTTGLTFAQASTGVNYFTMQASNGPPQLQAQGAGTDVGIRLVPKGTGGVEVTSGTLTLTNGLINATGTGTSYIMGNVGIGTQNPGSNRLKVQGDLEVVGNCINCSSDIRLKENITPLGSTLDRLLSIQGVSFTWSDPEKRADFPGAQIGVIAQDVEAVFPELVGTDARGFKFVRYDKLIAPTIEALREQQAQIAALETGGTPEINTEGFVLRTFLDQFITFAENSLTFVKTVTFQAQARFEQTTTFIGQTIFKNKSIFEKEVVFASQMGGRAVIKAGATQVAVTFDQAFSETPVITATAADFLSGQYRITNKSTTGFTLELSEIQAYDITFDWQALRVAQIITSESDGVTSTPIPTQVPEVSPSPVVSPAPTSTPNPSPTSEPLVSPLPSSEPSATESSQPAN